MTAEFFVGSGREAAVRRGFSAGIFIGMLAHLVAVGLTSRGGAVPARPPT